MSSAADTLLVVSPVYNEEANLEATARAVAAQTRPPDRWVVVDNGSSDGTLETARRLAREIPFMSVVEAGRAAPDGADKLALAREAHAFNVGLEQAGWRDFGYVGKLDGDVELPPEWFAELIRRFERNERLGLAAGRLVEWNGGTGP